MPATRRNRQQKRYAVEILEDLRRFDSWRSWRKDLTPAHSHAILRGLHPRLSASVDTWVRRRVPFYLTTGHGPDPVAFTDFKSINIRVSENVANEADYFGIIRGLTYHEAGHLLVTVPLPDLIAEAEKHAPTPITAGRNTGDVQWAWNVLEDQRMEATMVGRSPNLIKYYTPLVLRYIYGKADDYWLLAGRLYLPVDVRSTSREVAALHHGEDLVKEYEGIVTRYMGATDAHSMMTEVLRMVDMLSSHVADTTQKAVGQHTILPSPMLDNNVGVDDLVAAGACDKDDIRDAIKETRENANPQPGALSEAAKAARTAAADAFKNAEAERNKDDGVIQDRKAYNRAKQKAQDEGLPLELKPGLPNPKGLAQGETLYRAFANMIRQGRERIAPTWHEGQRHGVINVMRYKTRQPGDQEYRRTYAAGGDFQYPNLAVSVVLDGSGSMDADIEALGIAAYAMKKACEVAEVPCTVTTFSDNGTILWEPDDSPLFPPRDFAEMSGTDPTPVLATLHGQRFERQRHLVIIMTDGEWDTDWNSHHSLTEYTAPYRDIVLFFYRNERTLLKGLDAIDAFHEITSLEEMPQFLIRYLSRG